MEGKTIKTNDYTTHQIKDNSGKVKKFTIFTKAANLDAALDTIDL